MSSEADDARLVTASQTGDVDAFGQLIERYHNLISAIAYSRTGDRVASEDIAQETFLAAWNRIGELRDSDKLRAWLCSIARNLASKSLRGRRPTDDITEHAGELAGDAGPLDAMLTKEVETTVWSALEQLPEASGREDPASASLPVRDVLTGLPWLQDARTRLVVLPGVRGSDMKCASTRRVDVLFGRERM